MELGFGVVQFLLFHVELVLGTESEAETVRGKWFLSAERIELTSSKNWASPAFSTNVDSEADLSISNINRFLLVLEFAL